MKSVIVAAAAASALAVFFSMSDDPVTAEQIVAQPPAQVYAELDALFSAVERRAASSTPVVGNPPYPVKLTFHREHGVMRGLVAKAGFRSARIKIWIEPRAVPDETRLKVAVEPASMLDNAGMGDVHSAVEAVLRRTEAQLGLRKEIPALFGKPPEVDTGHSERIAARRASDAMAVAGSTKPMIDLSK